MKVRFQIQVLDNGNYRDIDGKVYSRYSQALHELRRGSKLAPSCTLRILHVPITPAEVATDQPITKQFRLSNFPGGYEVINAETGKVADWFTGSFALNRAKRYARQMGELI